MFLNYCILIISCLHMQIINLQSIAVHYAIINLLVCTVVCVRKFVFLSITVYNNSNSVIIIRAASKYYFYLFGIFILLLLFLFKLEFRAGNIRKELIK